MILHILSYHFVQRWKCVSILNFEYQKDVPYSFLLFATVYQYVYCIPVRNETQHSCYPTGAHALTNGCWVFRAFSLIQNILSLFFTWASWFTFLLIFCHFWKMNSCGDCSSFSKFLTRFWICLAFTQVYGY